MDNLSLIDWGALAANALWIVGLGLALASLSFAGFESSTARLGLGAILKQRGFSLILNLAGVLFCSGLAAVSRSLLELVLWIILAVLFCISTLLDLLKKQPR